MVLRVGLLLGGIFAFFLKRIPTLGLRNRIAVVPIRGVITDSKGPVDQIKKYRKDNRVKAIILRIDSPGGGTAASQEIYREVQRTVPKKKVVASMGNVAASGGYYVALAGR